MLQLKKLVKHPQLYNGQAGEFLRNGKFQQGTPKMTEEILALVKDAHVFVLDEDAITKTIDEAARPVGHQEITPGMVIAETYDVNRMQKLNTDALDKLPLALPFKVCWFETVGDDGMSSCLFMGTKDVQGNKLAMAEIGILVHEIDPGTYDLICLEMTPDYRVCVNVFRSVSTSGTSDPLPFYTLKMWLNALNGGQLAVEETEAVLHIPRVDRPSKSKPHHIRSIVRITSKARKSYLKPITAGGTISWSHRWESRGHWRRVPTVGKDRAGEYCVKGFTWVSQSIKGPEDAPLVVKTRVVT